MPQLVCKFKFATFYLKLMSGIFEMEYSNIVKSGNVVVKILLTASMVNNHKFMPPFKFDSRKSCSTFVKRLNISFILKMDVFGTRTYVTVKGEFFLKLIFKTDLLII